ncbi:hypothetical protein JJD41_06965 [Oxynema sp. CENA135]|uniref:hypothetical protein n=1 Tax=Oxynema sp. CENA135 TaxID=984206 RepID=UPI00190B7E84|nr:hypothetical protein [Oxynema sp. CENA135]MBK4729608.1 hypothetical protein [Oxynema sp. CENA135]
MPPRSEIASIVAVGRDLSVDRDEAHPQAVRSDAYMRLLQENERPARSRSSANTPSAKGSN